MAGDFQTGSSRPANRPSDPLLLTLAPRPLGESCHHGAAARQDSNQQPVWKHCSRWWQPGGVPVTWLQVSVAAVCSSVEPTCNLIILLVSHLVSCTVTIAEPKPDIDYSFLWDLRGALIDWMLKGWPLLFFFSVSGQVRGPPPPCVLREGCELHRAVRTAPVHLLGQWCGQPLHPNWFRKWRSFPMWAGRTGQAPCICFPRGLCGGSCWGVFPASKVTLLVYFNKTPPSGRLYSSWSFLKIGSVWTMTFQNLSNYVRGIYTFSGKNVLRMRRFPLGAMSLGFLFLFVSNSQRSTWGFYVLICVNWWPQTAT